MIFMIHEKYEQIKFSPLHQKINCSFMRHFAWTAAKQKEQPENRLPYEPEVNSKK